MNSRKKLLMNDRLEERRFKALLSIMETTLKILLSERRVAVKEARSGPAPAWSLIDKREVYVNRMAIDITQDFGKLVKLIKGLLYHEASHLMWTPGGANSGTHSRILQKTSEAGMSSATAAHLFNVLEDKRIEANFVKLYRPGAAFFAAPMYEYIVTDDAWKKPFDLWAMICGRVWLDPAVYDSVRAAAEAEIRNRATMAALDDVVRSYMVLSYMKMRTRPDYVADLIVSFWRLIQNETSSNGTEIGNCAGNHSERVVQQRAENENHRRDDPIDESGHVTEEDLDDLRAEAESKASEADGDGDGEEDEGEDHSGSSTGTESDEKGAAQAAANQALEDAQEAIEDDVLDTIRSVNKRAGTMGSVDDSTKRPLWSTTNEVVTPEMAGAARRIATGLQDIRNAAAPEWLRGETVGRLNVRRALVDDHSERMDIFDRWDEGSEDDMRIHVSLCVDQSGSMQRGGKHLPPYRAAAQTLWILQDAFVKADHVFDAYGYDDEFQRLTEPHRRLLYPVRLPSGGTEPISMLRDILTRSAHMHDIKDRLMIIITDGSWDLSDLDGYEEAFNAFRAIGGTSMLFMLQSAETHRFEELVRGGVIDRDRPYGVDDFYLIEQASDLIAPVTSYVQRTMRSHLTR